MYKKPIVIGVYYIFWIIFQLLPIFLLSGSASSWFSTDVTKMPVVLTLMWTSVSIGLFIYGMSLLNFNATMARASQSEISHRVRSYYLNPFVTVVLGFIVGLGVWVFTQGSLNESLNGSVIFLLAAIIGAVSMQLSYRLEWLMFRDYLDE
jgi:hypothetical protein